MTFRVFAAVLWALLAGSAQAAFDIDSLMRSLSQYPGGRARFTETRHLAVLDKPVVSSGEMTYTAPDRLEKRTLQPKPESMLLDKDTLSLERGSRKLTIHLGSRPEALAFVDSIRSTLSGNRAALEKNYQLKLSGTEQHWVLTLVPSEQKIAALLQRITVGGSRERVRSIEYLQADGDRTELAIEAMEQP